MPDVMPLASVGACFGFELRSNASLLYARQGKGIPLEIRVSVVDPAPSDAEPIMTMRAPTADRAVTGQVFLEDTHLYRMWVSGAGWFAVDIATGRVDVPETTSAVLREEGLWSVPARVLLVEHGHLPLHAAAVEIEGRAVVVAGPTRYGKTTLAAALAASGFRLLSEDLTDLTFTPDPVVLPGPAFLRLRRDVVNLLSIDGAVTVAESDARVHLALDPSARGTTDPVPVAALVLLRHGDDVVAERADTITAIRDVWSQGFALPTHASRAHAFDCVGRLVEAIPVLDLSRPLTADALPRTVDAVVDLVTSSV